MGSTPGGGRSHHGRGREVIYPGGAFLSMASTDGTEHGGERPQAETDGFDPSVPRPPDAAADRAVAALLDLLARRHTLALLYVFARDPGPWRYSELQQALDVPQNSLTRRLGDLVEAGLLNRRAYPEIPPRVEYTASDRAEALKPVFTRLYEWSRTATHTKPDGAEGRA